MPDLDFTINGVEQAAHGLMPLLHFKVGITNTPPDETIQSVILQAQIQIQAPQRSYNEKEKAKLIDLFGTPDTWGTTLRAKLWTLSSTTVRTFAGNTEAILPVPCSFDLNVAGTKFFYALEDGEVPLLFLFSGTIFYAAPDGRLQVQQISWNKECTYRMPINVWQKMMDHHYPNSAFISLERGVFDRLYEYKRGAGVCSWEQAIEKLLAQKTNGGASGSPS
ncbi:MAG: DUF6084 family protein [Verrucomicrobiota bacterium]|nr:DUF6084 family protein [Verrucomicrobiota bacterium]